MKVNNTQIYVVNCRKLTPKQLHKKIKKKNNTTIQNLPSKKKFNT